MCFSIFLFTKPRTILRCDVKFQVAATVTAAFCKKWQYHFFNLSPLEKTFTNCFNWQPILMSPLTFIHSNIQAYLKPKLIHSWQHTRCHYWPNFHRLVSTVIKLVTNSHFQEKQGGQMSESHLPVFLFFFKLNVIGKWIQHGITGRPCINVILTIN